MKKILIIDDDRIIRMLLKNILYLEFPTIQVVEAGNGLDALSLSWELRPDLIFLDFNMSGINGYHVVEALRDMPNMKSVPIVGISAMSTYHGDAAKMYAMCDAWFQKPFAKSDIIRLVAQLMSRYGAKSEAI